MKIALLNDTHFGVKNGSDIFLAYTEKFFDKVFFPYCVENNISHIIHLGDYFDNRKFLNIKVLRHNYETFISKLYENNISMDVILGNHDVYWKNTNKLNSVSQILNQYKIITIHEKPCEKTFDSLSIGFLPWIADDNYDESLEFINNSSAPIIVSHLELNGFKMMKGNIISSHGMDHKIFDRYEMVLSGHYHTKSERDNIYYLGTQYELTWADAGDLKYFHILDTETRHLEKIENPYKLFQRIYYDEDNIPALDKTHIDGTYVKVIVTNKKDYYKFDKWLDTLHTHKPFDVKIVESFDELTSDNVDDDNIKIANTPSLINSYVDSIETDLDVELLKKQLQALYVEAQSLDSI